MSYKDPNKQREYQRKAVAKRRADWLKDKVCVICGTNDQLEIDHIDPTLKVSHNVWSWSLIRMHEELDKCQVLCKEHHKDKTIKNGEHLHGESHPSAKLTLQQVEQARTRHANGEQIRPLAREYQVNRNTLRSALRRNTWS